jgi:hypothetical protein
MALGVTLSRVVSATTSSQVVEGDRHLPLGVLSLRSLALK